jgi:hypothetical protein
MRRTEGIGCDGRVRGERAHGTESTTPARTGHSTLCNSPRSFLYQTDIQKLSTIGAHRVEERFCISRKRMLASQARLNHRNQLT